MTDRPIPKFLWTLFKQLRRRHFPLGLDDYEVLRQALRAGFGWSSRETLRNLCCTLWAKSKREAEIIKALFDQFDMPAWQLPKLESQSNTVQLNLEPEAKDKLPDVPSLERAEEVAEPTPVTAAQSSLPPISLEGTELPKYHFILAPQFPLTYREVAQAWRRLRQPVRQGAPTELDIEATVDRRSRLGIVSTVVLVPRRRNTARLLLLVDQQGSMTPFHHFVDEVCIAIQQAGNLAHVARYYFHDTPAEGADETVLETLQSQLFPTLDAILSDIPPLITGNLYSDSDFLSPQALDQILEMHARSTAVVLLSDAGASRGRYDLLRLLDTIAFVKALRAYTTRYIWLNPLPRRYWTNSTAAQIARHLPMFPLDQAGMYQAVNVLRGQPYPIERPI